MAVEDASVNYDAWFFLIFFVSEDVSLEDGFLSFGLGYLEV